MANHMDFFDRRLAQIDNPANMKRAAAEEPVELARDDEHWRGFW